MDINSSMSVKSSPSEGFLNQPAVVISRSYSVEGEYNYKPHSQLHN